MTFLSHLDDEFILVILQSVADQFDAVVDVLDGLLEKVDVFFDESKVVYCICIKKKTKKEPTQQFFRERQTSPTFTSQQHEWRVQREG